MNAAQNDAARPQHRKRWSVKTSLAGPGRPRTEPIRTEPIRTELIRTELIRKGLFTTIPIVLASSMAMSLNLPVPPASAAAKRPASIDAPATTASVEAPRTGAGRTNPSELGTSIREALAAAHTAALAEATGAGTVTTAAVPASYTVAAGDSISGIAGRFGIATASVLALNGLGWKSVIFPGQRITLTSAAVAPIAAPAAARADPGRYTVAAGDTIGTIAAKFGVSTRAVLSANGLGWSSVIYPGRVLTIPRASATATTRAPLVPAVSIRRITANPGTHLIAGGETLSSIAARYSVSIQAILNANGLTWSSIIYGGRSLVIPHASPATPSTASSVTPLTAPMAENARIIIGVGRSLGVSDYGLVIALATAMQESSLRNIDHGDRDSLGLFQQRSSTGWGTPAEATDRVHASKLFFGGPTAPNRGVTRGLLDIPGWKSMTVAQAAQAVQLSGHPGAYAKWEVSAWAWLDQLR